MTSKRKFSLTDTTPLPRTTQAATQTGPPLRNYWAEIARTERLEQRHKEAMGQLREQAASREAEVKQMFDEHSVALKAKEKEVLDLPIALTEAKERVIREEERNSQRERELFAENVEIRSQQRELQDIANEYMVKWKIIEEQRTQLSDSYHELEAEGIITRE